jgi:integrase
VYAGKDPVTGRKRYVTGTAPTLEEARRLRDRLRAQHARRRATSRLTVADALNQWLDHHAPDMRPSSVRAARVHVDRHLIPHLGTIRLSRLGVEDLDRCWRQLRDAGLSAGYIRRVHNTLRSALNQALLWEWIADNPAARTRPKTPRPGRIAPPTPAGLVRLLELAQTDNPLFGLFLWLAAVTGARRGELCQLRWRAVDLDQGRLLFEADTTKNEDDKLVSLDAATVELLRGWRARRRQEALACGLRLGPDSFVFSYDPAGRSMPSADGFSHAFARLRKQAATGGDDYRALARVRLHDLRHWAATSMLAGGIPLRTAAGRLGHRDASVTARTYAAFLPATDQVAADLLAGLLQAVRDQPVTSSAVPSEGG